MVKNLIYFFTMLIIAFAFLLTASLLFAAPNDILKPGNHYFTEDWCKYCQEQGITIQTLQDQGYTIQIYKQETDPKIFKKLNIKKIPVVIVVKVNEKGRQISVRLVGTQPIKKLVEVLVKDDKEK